MNKLLTAVLAGAALLCGGVSAMGADTRTTFTYAPYGSDTYRFGKNKAETYDVAIRIDDPALVGKRIVGVVAPIMTDESIADPSCWLSSALKLENKKNVADIASQSATLIPSTDTELASLQTTFATPYTITEAGVYVGYTFTVSVADTEDKKTPLAVTYGPSDNGFFIHTSRSYLKWRNRKEALLDGAVSCMKVIIEGEFQPHSVGVASITPLLMEANKDASLKVEFVNHGSEPVATINYTYTIGSEAPVSATHTFATPLPPQYGASAQVNIPVRTSLPSANYPVVVKVTEVNGVANADVTASATGEVSVIDFVPVTRPLVEEYTGTWCGYCPRGYIAMERLNHMYGDRFLGLAFHAGSGGGYEPMQMVTEFPSSVDGFPMSVVNRVAKVDPYYGNTNQEHMGITKLWEQLASQMADADVNVALSWDDATHLRARAKVRFVKSSTDADYRISFCLTGDNLTGEAWKGTSDVWYQSNYFAGESSEAFPGDDWKVFTQGGKVVLDLVYNDVVLKYDNPKGLPGSLPSAITAGEVIEVEQVFDLSTIRNFKGYDIVNDPTSLRVAAIVTQGAAGNYINGHKSPKAGPQNGGSNPDGIEGVAANTPATPVAEQWHDLQGRPLAGPLPTGITLRTVTLSDGTTHTTKHIAR